MAGWGGPRPGAGRKPGAGAKRKPVDAARTAALRKADAGTKAAEPKPLAISPAVLEQVLARGKRARSETPHFNPFQLPAFPPKALPPQKMRMAMDSASSWAGGEWAGGALGSIAAEGLTFLGYPYLAELAQRPEYRVISDTIATEMTRKWIEFKGTGDQDKTERIKELNDFLDHLGARDRFCDAAAQDGYFGRSHIFPDFGDITDEELTTPIGNGRDDVSKSKIKKGSLRGLRTIEAVWTYPTTYNAVNPLQADWYNPQVWYVMGKQIHRSRLPTFIGRPVPDLLKPSYAFGGLSLSQIAKPYVDIWLQTRESIASLIHSFSVMVLCTDLQTILQPGSASGLLQRVALFNALRDNQGLMVVNKNTEDFKNVSASLAGLHELQAQSQEHMASVARIPLVKFTGISPAGLNASSEGEMRAFYDTIAAYQNQFFRPNLTLIVHFAMLSLWGEVDSEITYDFVPLWAMTEKEEAEVRKLEAETDDILVNGCSAISPEEVRTRVAGDPDTPYAGLDPDDVPEPPELAEGAEGGKINLQGTNFFGTGNRSGEAA